MSNTPFKSLILKRDSEIAARLLADMEQDADQLLRDYKKVFSTPEGMRVLEHIVSLVPIYRPSTDLRDQGGADAVQKICEYIGLADPFIYPEMMRRIAERTVKLRQENNGNER